MALMTIPDPIYIVVRDIDSASAWYIEKLGCHRVPLTPDAEEGSVVLKFDNEGSAIVLGPPPRESDSASPTPILYTAHIQKAREALSSRGVYVGTIEQDRQGTYYFEMRDLDGNVIEVSEEP